MRKVKLCRKRRLRQNVQCLVLLLVGIFLGSYLSGHVGNMSTTTPCKPVEAVLTTPAPNSVQFHTSTTTSSSSSSSQLLEGDDTTVLDTMQPTVTTPQIQIWQQFYVHESGYHFAMPVYPDSNQTGAQNSQQHQNGTSHHNTMTPEVLTVPDDWPEFFVPHSQQQFSLDYPYLHTASGTCNLSVDLLVMTLSLPENKDQRVAIRTTWGSVARTGTWPGQIKNTTLKLSKSLGLVFLVGVQKEKDKKVSKALKAESKKHGDIVQWKGLHDTYFNLTMKVLLGLKWVTEFCPKASYVVKTDDDTFVHVPRLIQILTPTETATPTPAEATTEVAAADNTTPTTTPTTTTTTPTITTIPTTTTPTPTPTITTPTTTPNTTTTPTTTPTIWGPYFTSAQCERGGKLAVSPEAYPFQYYPPHVKGNLYLLTADLVSPLVKTAPYLPYNNMEDVHVTGTLARVLGARHRSFSWREFSISSAVPDLCLFEDNVLVTGSQSVCPTRANEFWMTFLGTLSCRSNDTYGCC